MEAPPYTGGALWRVGEGLGEVVHDIFDTDILRKYEFHDYGHALEILSGSFPEELDDLRYCLKEFTFTENDILKGGGNESSIPKKISSFLYPRGWSEIQIKGGFNC